MRHAKDLTVMSSKTAVLAVHGISPQQRYGIQDQFAEELCSRLNRLSSDDWGFPLPSNCAGPWQTSVYFPPISPNAAVDDMRPTVVRLHKASEPDVNNPREPVIDVYEAYWSPLDKNQTKAFSVVNWILRNLFVPANTSARLDAKPVKTLFDLMYFLTVLLIVAALSYAIVALGTEAYRHYVTISAASRTSMPVPAPHASSPLGSAKVLVRPKTIIETLPSRVIYSVALSLVAAYLIVQALIGLIGLVWNVKRAWSDRGQAVRRLVISFAIFSLGVWMLLSASNLQLAPNQRIGTSAWLLAGCVFAFRTILSIGQDFLVNCFGDIQIYCTHDENSRFFVLRQAILETVETTLARILRTSASGADPLYERVVVVAHSLGSTISMDALLNLHNLAEEGGLQVDQWRRIRAFITLGTALEKTKFFFDAQHPGLSASYQQWRSDLYGHLFTGDFQVLQKDNSVVNPVTVGIYWANYWYFPDIVSNAIDSYRSDILPGHALTAIEPNPLQVAPSAGSFESMKVVSQNARLGSRFAIPNPLHVWVHSDYFGDDAFWRSGKDKTGAAYHGVLEVLMTS